MANSPPVEAEVAAWFDATTLDEEKTVARRLNNAALDHVVCAPLGFFLRRFAWRKSLTGVAHGPLPFFWGVSKTASPSLRSTYSPIVKRIGPEARSRQ